MVLAKRKLFSQSAAFGKLQTLSKSLVYPIAILPFAAILLRFGALGLQYSSETHLPGLFYFCTLIETPASVVFNNLGLWFAIALAFGLSKDQRGEAALIGGLGYLILTAFTSEQPGIPLWFYQNVFVTGGHSELLYAHKGDAWTYMLNTGVFGGITIGCIVAYIYNKCKSVELPVYLSFFSGRRFVPMVTIVALIPLGVLFALAWPWLQFGLSKAGNWLGHSGDSSDNAIATDTAKQAGAFFIYGTLNRLLLPFGLHHVINTFVWFTLPISGQYVIGSNFGQMNSLDGDINAFAQGLGGAGLFQSGFFPMFMGGLPAIGLAMIMSAKKENRKGTLGFLGGAMVVAFVTGISEPLEFSFLFLSPILWGIHAFLTGFFGAIVTAMHIKVGFGFSAGLIDYLISLPTSFATANAYGNFNFFGNGINNQLYMGSAWTYIANPLWILVLAALCGACYYFSFTYVIRKFNLASPGRTEDTVASTTLVDKTKSNNSSKATELAHKATIIINALPESNIVSIENCASRLRIKVKDSSLVNDAAIKPVSFGIVKPNKENVQIVIGPTVELLKDEVQKQLSTKTPAVEN